MYQRPSERKKHSMKKNQKKKTAHTHGNRNKRKEIEWKVSVNKKRNPAPERSDHIAPTKNSN